jgi:hypothetical protein
MEYQVYRYDDFTTINDYRLSPIDYLEFINFLSVSKNPDKFLHKRIYNPTSDILNFTPNIIYNKDYYVAPDNVIYPSKEISIICETCINKTTDTNYLVFPTNDALFTILLCTGETRRGFWKDQIQWLNNTKIVSLWTDSKCVLINEKIFKNNLDI